MEAAGGDDVEEAVSTLGPVSPQELVELGFLTGAEMDALEATAEAA
jgi:hypothetical protein